MFQIYSTTVGASLRWYKDLFDWRGPEDQGEGLSYDLLCEEAARSAPGANGVLYLPYLQGAQQCSAVSGSFRNLRLSTGKGDLTRALLEGCAMSVRYNMDQMEAAAGMRAEEITVAGGGSKSPVWTQIFADILEKPLRVSALKEAALTGAAMLAGKALGHSPRTVRAQTGRVLPDGGNRAAYRKIYGEFVKTFMKDIEDVVYRDKEVVSTSTSL